MTVVNLDKVRSGKARAALEHCLEQCADYTMLDISDDQRVPLVDHILMLLWIEGFKVVPLSSSDNDNDNP